MPLSSTLVKRKTRESDFSPAHACSQHGILAGVPKTGMQPGSCQHFQPMFAGNNRSARHWYVEGVTPRSRRRLERREASWPRQLEAWNLRWEDE